MKALFRKLALVLSIGILLTGANVRAELLQPSGSRVVIDAPAGFTLAEGFTGLVREDYSSFMIAEFPASAFEEIKGNFNASNLEKMRLSNAKPVRLERSDDYVAWEGTAQVAIGDGMTAMTRFMLLVRDDKSTAMVTANIVTNSLSSGDIKRDDIVRALTGVSLREMKAQEFPFTLGYTGSLKYAGTMAGFGSIYNLQGRLPEKRLEAPEPGFVVSVIPKTFQDIDDIKAYVEELVKARAKGGEVQIKELAPITIGTLQGWAFDVIAEESFGIEERDERVAIYSVGLTYDEGVVWLYARAPLAESGKWMPEFRKIAASFSLKKDNEKAEK